MNTLGWVSGGLFRSDGSGWRKRPGGISFADLVQRKLRLQSGGSQARRSLLRFHPSAGEICAFKIHGQELPFEAVVLNKTSGEGRLRAKSPIDCELQKEYTFIIQAYDCGAGPRETAWKKSHK